jgi:metallo-beta-lactamase family protein
MYPPTKPKKADYVFWRVLMEIVLHPESDPKLELEMYINNTFKMGGTVLSLCSRTCTNDYVFAMAKEEVKPVPTLWIRLWVSAFDVFL